MAENKRIRTVCVFCGSSTGKGSVYAAQARLLGRTLAENGLHLVYGGSNIGLMRILADEVMMYGGSVTGIMPHSLAGKEIAHRGITKLYLVDSMHERKAMMDSLSDAFIAMPGGIGTLDELFEILSWNQLDIISKPVALFNVSGYFDHLIRFLDHTVRERFVRPEHRSNLLIDDDAVRLIHGLLSFEMQYPPQKWVDELKVETEKLTQS